MFEHSCVCFLMVIEHIPYSRKQIMWMLEAKEKFVHFHAC